MMTNSSVIACCHPLTGLYTHAEVDGLVDDYLARKGHSALERWCKPARDRFIIGLQDARVAENQTRVEELLLWRKDVGTYLRQYDFLSQLFDYQDPWLEKLAIYLKHLAPQLTDSALQTPIDLSTVQLDFITQREKETVKATPEPCVQLRPTTEAGTGTAHDPEMAALADVIAAINDLFAGDHPDSSLRNVVTHVKDRLEASPTLRQQARSNTLAQFSANPDLTNEFNTAVLGAMESSHDISVQILNTPQIAQKLLEQLVPLIYRHLNDKPDVAFLPGAPTDLGSPSSLLDEPQPSHPQRSS
jgi:type I restriction enzyme R subunit